MSEQRIHAIEKNGKPTTTGYRFREACLVIAKELYGEQGEWMYAAFDAINQQYYGNTLPTPLITVEITPYGKCLGSTRPTNPPIVRLHPTLFGWREKQNPWNVPTEWLGLRYAFDVLLHETVHVNISCNLGGWREHGSTSHNNSLWVGEVNRLCSLLGWSNIQAGRSVSRRMNGYVVKANQGNLPFINVATFPYGIRKHLGEAHDYYINGSLPVDV